MQTLTKLIIEHGLRDRIVRISQLSSLVGGNEGRLYGLVNRALSNGELLRLQRGLYILADFFRQNPAHPFSLANAIMPGSYISFETALSFHNWIPEHVQTTACVVPGRKSQKYVNEKIGNFSFHPLAIKTGSFLELVNRYHVDGQTMLIAKPCRALMDLICLRKTVWQGMGWLSEGLRIDSALLRSITKKDFKILMQVYKHQRIKSFICSLMDEINYD